MIVAKDELRRNEMELEFLPCPTCREVCAVEMPPCLDDHGTQCPDRACTQCGTALTVDGVYFADGFGYAQPVRASYRDRAAA